MESALSKWYVFIFRYVFDGKPPHMKSGEVMFESSKSMYKARHLTLSLNLHPVPASKLL